MKNADNICDILKHKLFLFQNVATKKINYNYNTYLFSPYYYHNFEVFQNRDIDTIQ